MDIKHKIIAALSGKILSAINAKNRTWFTLQEAYAFFPDLSREALRLQLKRMVDNGLLFRVKDGVYYVIPFEQDSLAFMPDWHLLAEPLTGAVHYIGYYSALQIHNLITQPSLAEQIVVNKQIKPSTIQLKGVRFQFIYHNSVHFFGCKKIWIDSYNKVLCSDLEKTLIDCLYKPAYAGGIVEIAKAIFMSRDKISCSRLLDYIRRFNSQAIIKRLGYLLELLNIDNPAVEQLNTLKTDAIVLLDPELPRQGKTLKRWSIQQNVDIHTIKSATTT